MGGGTNLDDAEDGGGGGIENPLVNDSDYMGMVLNFGKIGVGADAGKAFPEGLCKILLYSRKIGVG